MMLAQRFSLPTLNLAPDLNLVQNLNLSTPKTLKISMTLVFCAGSFMLIQPAHAENNGRIIKWKDEKGITHYGDSLPPQYSNRENSLINKQGIIIQQNKIPDPQQESSSEQLQTAQTKKDKALLGTFSSAEEIDLTRERNLEPELLAMKNLQQDRSDSLKKHGKIKTLAETYNKTKKPLPADLKEALTVSQEEIAKIDQKILVRQKTIDEITLRFDEDKKRYLYLRKKNAQAD